MKKAEMVSFCFENCESVEIPVRWLRRFRISGIHEEIGKRLGDVEKTTYADFCEMELYWDIEKEVHRFGGLLCGVRDHIRNWRFLERVRAQRDIVSISVKYEEGLEETYYLPWTSLDFTETSNALQKAFYTRNGNLRIRIKKRSEV